jgi:Zn finger protein HypA/HybF involved in hydrogenase expression
MTNLLTETQLVQAAIETIEKMSPMEKAKLRIEMRKAFNLPAQPEPDARIN